MKQSNTQHLNTHISHLSTFKEYLIIKGYTKRTQEEIIKVIGSFTQWTEKENIEPTNISYNDILAYVNHCKQKGNKQSSIKKKLTSIKHYYDFLISENHLEENPCSNIDIKGIKRRTIIETFTPDELETIYKNYKSDNHLISKRNKIIVGLIIYQGMRSEELARLTPQDIKPREGKINIAGSLRTNERELKLEAHQLYDLMDYINETRKLLLAMTGKDSKQLFVSIGNSDQFKNIMQKLLQRLRQQNKKIKDIKHIRASVISNWLKLYNTRKVQVMAGHKYISSTEAYKINNMEEMIEDINKYHPIS